jgi:hydroxyethylthiazole kinase
MGAADVRAALYGRPVVQCITNHVTVNDVANLILAMGASPIMAHHIREAAEVQENASALMLNLGATDDYEAMKEAMRAASESGHPVVIDPVGIGVSSYRRDQLKALLDIAPPACIRGNYSEILALYDDRSTLKGLDDDRTTEDNKVDVPKERMEIVSRCASRYNTIVAASGSTDIISDGSRTVCVRSGHPMQRRITGSGCMLSAAIASVFALSPADRMALTEGICRYIGSRAAEAAGETMAQGDGSMSFRLRFMDMI